MTEQRPLSGTIGAFEPSPWVSAFVFLALGGPCWPDFLLPEGILPRKQACKMRILRS